MLRIRVCFLFLSIFCLSGTGPLKKRILATQIEAKSGNPDASLNIRFPNLLGRGELLKEKMALKFEDFFF